MPSFRLAGLVMLRDQQKDFLAALFKQGGDPGAEALIKAGMLGTARRLEIYRHNVISNLVGALQEIYPVTRNIVGDAFFRHAAEAYCRETPSRSGDLNDYGESWPEFIAAWPHAAELPYLADTGRLEWAMHRAFHAADVPPFDLARLGAIPEEAVGQLHFQLHPAVALMASAYPVADIWRVNQPDFSGNMSIDWQSPGDRLCVHRSGYRSTFDVLAEPELRFLSALTCGAPFESAADAALNVDASFDLQGFLLQSVQSGVITDFR